MEIRNIQRLRDFIGSLPIEFKEEFKKYMIEERNNDLFSQGDVELMFISDNWDELEKLGWLTEC